MKLVKRVLLVASALICVGAMGSCSNKSEDFMDYVDNGKFEKAADYYSNKIKGSAKEDDIRDELEDEIEDYYDDIIEKYLDGDYDEDDIEDFINLLDELDIDTDDFEEELEDELEKKTDQSHAGSLPHSEDKDDAGTSSIAYLMPNLVGMDIDDAQEEYDFLEINVQSQEYSEYEEGVIIEQRTSEGQIVSEGYRADVTVSLGVEKIIIPDVSNITSEAAALMLKELGLITTVNLKYDAEVPEGYVISTEPAANTQVLPGEEITIYVSTGSGVTTETVPNLIGYDYGEAASILELRGFRVSKYEVDSNEDKDVVIGQSVDPYEELETGSEIILTVSNGVDSSANEGYIDIYVDKIYLGMSVEEMIENFGEYDFCAEHVNFDDDSPYYEYVYYTDRFTYSLSGSEVGSFAPAKLAFEFSEEGKLRLFALYIGVEPGEDGIEVYPLDEVALEEKYQMIYDEVLLPRYGEGEASDDLIDMGIVQQYIWDGTENGDIWFINGIDSWGAQGWNYIILSYGEPKN